MVRWTKDLTDALHDAVDKAGGIHVAKSRDVYKYMQQGPFGATIMSMVERDTDPMTLTTVQSKLSSMRRTNRSEDRTRIYIL